MPAHQLNERWFVVDVKDRVLGRVATEIAKRLMGKDLSTFNGAVDAKTNVVVVNAGEIKLTGAKLEDKKYYKHSGYLGHLKTTTAGKILEGKKPEDVLTKSVYGMLPKNKLRHVMMKRLRVFAGPEHVHTGQNPETLEI